MAAILEVPKSSLDGASGIDNVETWDSLHHMSLVLALEEEFGIRFPEDEIAQLTSLSALRNALATLVPDSAG
jgi:acyl carrier protein